MVKYIIELKIWRGERYNAVGEKQLSEYLKYWYLNTGYMFSFNSNKKMDYKDEYSRWLKNVKETDLHDELEAMNETIIEDAFYRDLAFGTGGLRGTIGAVTNRMNVYVVAKASQGLSRYLLEKYEKSSVVIGYDSRIKSDVFARTAAAIFATNGIHVHIWPELNPVPTCPYPNPEIREAMELGLEYASRLNADLLLATDPDCDRCGIAVK